MYVCISLDIKSDTVYLTSCRTLDRLDNTSNRVNRRSDRAADQGSKRDRSPVQQIEHLVEHQIRLDIAYNRVDRMSR